MEHIRVSNLRCLADSTAIEIKPISLLVGANSSGKSTFLRVFPLLRQSHEMRTLGGLVLNEGDVNFGFFREALHNNARPQELKLEFGFRLNQGYFQGSPWNQYLLDAINITCELTYVPREQDTRYPRLRTVKLKLGSGLSIDELSITADDDGLVSDFRVNDFQSSSEEKALLRLLIGRGVVPQLAVALIKEDQIDGGLQIEGGHKSVRQKIDC
jgi:AAA ATPase domain